MMIAGSLKAGHRDIFLLEWFHDFLPSTGDQVKLGENGNVDIEGTDIIYIKKYVDGKWFPS